MARGQIWSLREEKTQWYEGVRNGMKAFDRIGLAMWHCSSYQAGE